MADSSKTIQTFFGENLKRIREKAGLSLSELSDLCNIHRSNLSKIEKGELNITLEKVKQLAEALEVEYWEFFN